MSWAGLAQIGVASVRASSARVAPSPSREVESCSNAGVDESDRALMRRLACGERSALEPLMARHYARLYRIALGYLRQPDDALDAVQEVFVRAFQHAPSWKEQAEPGAWLTRITVNQAIDRYRRGRRRRDTEQPLADDGRDARFVAASPAADRRVFGRELRERVERALLGLPERQRAVFVLRHYEELPLEEISRTLEMNLGTVKSNLHRALVHLRRRLAGVRG